MPQSFMFDTAGMSASERAEEPADSHRFQPQQAAIPDNVFERIASAAAGAQRDDHDAAKAELDEDTGVHDTGLSKAYTASRAPRTNAETAASNADPEHTAALSGQQVDAVRRLSKSGRCLDAFDMLDACKGSLPGVTQETLRGEIYLAQSKLSEASACFMAVLGEHAHDELALRALAEIHRRNDDLESAFLVRSPCCCRFSHVNLLVLRRLQHVLLSGCAAFSGYPWAEVHDHSAACMSLAPP